MAAAAGLALLALLAAAGAERSRKVSMEYNPGWNSSSVNLLHVRAVGPGDSLHYVWSSIGAPSVLLVATRSPSSALRVNWTQLLSPSPAGAVWIDPPDSVVYSSAVVFTKLFEFSEAKPLGELFYPTYDLSEFSWDSLNHTLNHTALTAELRGVPATDPGGAFANGSLAFRVTAYEAAGRAGPLPSLLHTADSSQLEFIVAGVSPRGNGSRFALQLAAVEPAGAARRLRARSSIDDEYTPSIFQELSLLAEAPNGSSPLSFVQWKAAAYGSPSPRREDGIQCRAGGLQAANGSLPGASLLRAFFGDSLATSCTLSVLNVSFGGEEGHVYQERRYLSWSVLLGFGEPPRDTFSPLVISITAVALGTPLAMLLLGSCLVLLAQRRRYSEYEPIN
ncbi:glycosylated lysosomal membrane protein isoform X1 [Camarhynchus parvulus]|uniref:glycosylated lysosomal membrane protein isoform X1 n=2 Tax=Geospiza parvula TaxID=87175 RepID=UPI0012382C64|nr:glycosylated lysosomal membrane protein isoform X1 [Camarhynchus parvulus]